jgi:ribosome maturation factor RimP
MTTTTTTTEPFLTPHVGAEETLRAVVEPIVVAEGLELVVLQLVRGQQRDLVRLSVDRPGAGVTPGKGVSMAELEHLNRLLGDLLDVEDAERKLFKEHWELEVGSPGVDRPLTKRSHFNDVVGSKVKARLRLEKKSLLGRLESVDADGVVIDGARVAFADLDHAHVVFEFAPPQKPGKASKPGKGSKPGQAKGEKSPKAGTPAKSARPAKAPKPAQP